MDRTDRVDQHDPPEWMRELVILRDSECVFPYCHNNARDCDLDHIEAYVEMDDGGPPGQTRPDNLAPLCRRHHRAKTHRGWTYRPQRRRHLHLDQPARTSLHRRDGRHRHPLVIASGS